MRNSHNTHSKVDDQGVVALEFVLVAPFLIALIFAIASVRALLQQESRRDEYGPRCRPHARAAGNTDLSGRRDRLGRHDMRAGRHHQRRFGHAHQQLHVLDTVHPTRHQDDHSDRDHAMRRLSQHEMIAVVAALFVVLIVPVLMLCGSIRVRWRSRHRRSTPDTERRGRRCPRQGHRLCQGRSRRPTSPPTRPMVLSSPTRRPAGAGPRPPSP